MKIKAEKVLKDVYGWMYKPAAELKGITPMDAPDYIEELERVDDLTIIAHSEEAFEVLERLAYLNEWSRYSVLPDDKGLVFESLDAISTGGDNFWDEDNEEWNEEYYSHS